MSSPCGQAPGEQFANLPRLYRELEDLAAKNQATRPGETVRRNEVQGPVLVIRAK